MRPLLTGGQRCMPIFLQAARSVNIHSLNPVSDLGSVAGLGLDQTEVLVRSLSRWFQLVNLAEDNERVRRLRRRAAREAPAPRRGSMRDAIAELAARGT